MSPGCGPLSGVALVDIGQLDAVAGLGLDQALHLGPISGAGRRDVKGEHMGKGVQGEVQLGALIALAPSYPALSPLSGEDRRVRL